MNRRNGSQSLIIRTRTADTLRSSPGGSGFGEEIEVGRSFFFYNGSLESQSAADSAKKRRQGRVKKILN
jgi:hypothetical protein